VFVCVCVCVCPYISHILAHSTPPPHEHKGARAIERAARALE
jgi:hypothetical protein